MREQESIFCKYVLFQAPAPMQTTSPFFCDIRQRRLVVSNRRFGTPSRTHLLDTLAESSSTLSQNFGNNQSTLRNIPEERALSI
jgi:hypothetical protein